jgi:hypothetical protein
VCSKPIKIKRSSHSCSLEKTLSTQADLEEISIEENVPGYTKENFTERRVLGSVATYIDFWNKFTRWQFY